MRVTWSRLLREQGFGLIELTVLIVIVGILAAVAMQSAQMSLTDSREAETRNELQALSQAIVGNPGLMTGGQRSDFGYVGDVGAFPPDLTALYQNPGGYSTWNGPYLPPGFLEDSTDYLFDAWGRAYNYDGSLTITSTGSGSNLVQSLGRSESDFLQNELPGTVADSSGGPPGIAFADSVSIQIDIPDGSGNTVVRTVTVTPVGTFAIDSLPIGLHPIRAIYLPEFDTLSRYVAIMPRHRGHVTFRFPSVQFTSSSNPSVDNTIIVSTQNSASLVGQSMEDEDLVAYDRILMTASMYMEGDPVFDNDEDIDAVHVDSVGTVVLSTTGSAQIGSLSFDDDDLVRYNPLTGTATLIFDGSAAFTGNENIDAVYVYPNGLLAISTVEQARAVGLDVEGGDVFGYDPAVDTAWIIFDGSAVFAEDADVDAVHILDDGRIILSCDDQAEIGSLTFEDEDLVLYDPGSGLATLFWDGDVPFGGSGEDVDALHIGYVAPPSGNLDSLVLHPNGVGSESQNSTDGCGDNYECVDESSSDEDATRIERADNSYADDAYALEDPSGGTGTIVGVRVLARCRKHHSQGDVRLLLSIASNEYYGTSQSLSSSYADYSETWSTNPATGSDWTWPDITDLQAGVSLRGQNHHFPAYCTMVWVEVIYAD